MTDPNQPTDDDDIIAEALAATGAPYGMSAADVAAHIAVGDRRHEDAPDDVCGAVDPRDESRWCALASEHPGEDHNNYAPPDSCKTWIEHDQHATETRHVFYNGEHIGEADPSDSNTI